MCLSILSSTEFDASDKETLKHAYNGALAKLEGLPGLSRRDFHPDDIAEAVMDLFRDGQRDVRRLTEDAVFKVIRAVPTTIDAAPRASKCDMEQAAG